MSTKLYIRVLACQLLLTSLSYADPCTDFRQPVRTAAQRYLGLDWPWHYDLGQLKQESHCRPSITAFDGGQGLAQFMPATAEAVSRKAGIPLNPYNPHDATILQALFLRDLNRSNPSDRLWPVFQIYNGGAVLLKREAARAGAWDHARMRAVCQRNIIRLKSGRLLNLCDVNYSYSEQIFNFGSRYRVGPDARPYW